MKVLRAKQFELGVIGALLGLQALLYQANFYSLDNNQAVYLLKLVTWSLIIGVVLDVLFYTIRGRYKGTGLLTASLVSLALGMLLVSSGRILFELVACRGCGYNGWDVVARNWFAAIPAVVVLVRSTFTAPR